MRQDDSHTPSIPTIEQLESGTRVRLLRSVRCGGVLFPAGSTGELVVEPPVFGVRFERAVAAETYTVTVYWPEPPVVGVDFEINLVERASAPPIMTSRARTTYPVPPTQLPAPPSYP